MHLPVLKRISVSGPWARWPARLLVGVLAARGVTRLALEDPSSGDDALPAARAAGLEVTGIPVDGNGIRVDLLAASGAEHLDLDHYLEILLRKPGALPGSVPLAQARAAGTFTAAHQQLWDAARAQAPTTRSGRWSPWATRPRTRRRRYGRCSTVARRGCQRPS